jgi:hypothetical protein
MLTRNAATARKIGGRDGAHGLQLIKLAPQEGGGDMLAAGIGAGPAIGLENAVDRGADGRRIRAARQAHHDLIEGALLIGGGLQRLAVHPQNAEQRRIRHELAGGDGVDVFRRQGDA